MRTSEKAVSKKGAPAKAIVRRPRRPASEPVSEASRDAQAPEDQAGDDNYSFPGQDSFGLLLRMSMFGLRRSFKEQLAEAGIPWSVWYYLRVLWDHDGLSQKELTKWVGMLQPNAVGSIQTMKKLGLVNIERESSDRRRICVWLTPHARELKEALLPKVRERIETVAFKGFTGEERQHLTKLLAKVCANVTRLP
jgi:DNA-binding MarR family transcriptional regulator